MEIPVVFLDMSGGVLQGRFLPVIPRQGEFVSFEGKDVRRVDKVGYDIKPEGCGLVAFLTLENPAGAT